MEPSTQSPIHTNSTPAIPTSRGEVGLILFLGLAGLVISWAFFYKFMRANGLAFEYFWEEALWTGDSTGLVWDLLATGGIVTVMALYRRRTLGALRLAIVLACTLVLGVCVGLAALCAFLHATPQTPRRG